MNVIRGVLKEELANSLRMERRYEAALRQLPKGSLIAKRIKGHVYYYLAVRQGPKVKLMYKGRLAASERQAYREAQRRRQQCRKLLRQVKQQIAFLRRALRGASVRTVS